MTAIANKKGTGKSRTLGKRLYKNRWLLLLLLPCFVYYVMFRYVPMWGILVAFKDFKPFIGFAGSKWVAFKNFERFFASPDAWRVVRNTVWIGLITLIFSFPVPIMFAIALNEVRCVPIKKVTQTVSYMPHFLSAVIICGMITSFTSPVRGIINQMIEACGGTRINFLSEKGWFVPIYVISDIWEGTGWGAILYLAAITNIDPQMYEAATLDGASRLRQITAITIPTISPTIVTMLILKVGSILDVGLEKVLLLQSPAIYETSDIIATYVYRQGLAHNDVSYATAVGLFSSIANLILLLAANTIANRVSENGLF